MKEDLYGDKVQQDNLSKDKSDKSDNVDYSFIFNEIDYGIDFDESIVYLCDEINKGSLFFIISRIRAILKLRNEKDKKNPINLMINSSGGDMYETFGIVDYIRSLSVKVNTICRGTAFSSAILILASGTGTRAMSQHSFALEHEMTASSQGNFSDMKVDIKQLDLIENVYCQMLVEYTKKDSNFWKDKIKNNDLYFTALQAKEYGVIDFII